MRATSRTTKKPARAAVRPRLQLDERARAAGCHLGSIGEVEQLAGVDVQSHKDRTALWQQFSHLYHGPTQTLIDAVMDHCSAIALKRLDRGELCLLATYR